MFIHIVQELCESRGGRPGLPVLMSLVVSVDFKHHVYTYFVSVGREPVWPSGKALGW